MLFQNLDSAKFCEYNGIGFLPSTKFIDYEVLHLQSEANDDRMRKCKIKEHELQDFLTIAKSLMMRNGIASDTAVAEVGLTKKEKKKQYQQIVEADIRARFYSESAEDIKNLKAEKLIHDVEKIIKTVHLPRGLYLYCANNFLHQEEIKQFLMRPTDRPDPKKNYRYFY